MVALMHGVHRVEIGDAISAYLDQENLFVFDRNENLVFAPGLNGQG
jgi:glycerol transport system ATP-binding protein